MKNNEEQFLGLLLSETYLNTKNEEFPAASEELRVYFEKKLNEVHHSSLIDYLEGHNLFSSRLDYLKHLKCYRLNIKECVLDFPENWSIFKDLSTTDLIYIDKDFNTDMLLDLFAELLEREVELLIIKDKTETRLVYLNADHSKEHLEWTRRYVEKSKNNEAEKAA